MLVAMECTATMAFVAGDAFVATIDLRLLLVLIARSTLDVDGIIFVGLIVEGWSLRGIPNVLGITCEDAVGNRIVPPLLCVEIRG